jgi:PleD family two-component response regulator
MSSGLTSAFFPRLRSRGDEPRTGTWWRASTREHSTGFLNPTALESVGASMVRAATRRGEPLSALVLRCDPPAGKQSPDPATTIAVADALRASFSGDEVVARNGAEFVVLLPATDEVGAVEACATVAAAFEHDPEEASIGEAVAIGTATRAPEGDGAMAALLTAARARVADDAALKGGSR